VKWIQILRLLIRDVLIPGLGVWIIWKQTEAAVTSTPLLIFAGACFWPAAQSAIITILSGLGSSSGRRELPEEPPPPSLPPGGGTGERG
jgi:hypothetical protein